MVQAAGSRDVQAAPGRRRRQVGRAAGQRAGDDARRDRPAQREAGQAVPAQAVGLVGRLYAIEDRGKAMDEAGRLTLRRHEWVPVLSALKDKLLGWRERLLPKHPMAQATNYALNQWPS